MCNLFLVTSKTGGFLEFSISIGYPKKTKFSVDCGLAWDNYRQKGKASMIAY